MKEAEQEQLKPLALYGSITGKAVAFVELEQRFPGFLKKLEKISGGQDDCDRRG